jgi:hypothetical protein
MATTIFGIEATDTTLTMVKKINKRVRATLGRQYEFMSIPFRMEIRDAMQQIGTDNPACVLQIVLTNAALKYGLHTKRYQMHMLWVCAAFSDLYDEYNAQKQ